MNLKEILDSQSEEDFWETLNAGGALTTLDKEYDKWSSYSSDFNIPASMLSEEMRQESREVLEKLPQVVLQEFITPKWQVKLNKLMTYLRDN